MAKLTVCAISDSGIMVIDCVQSAMVEHTKLLADAIKYTAPFVWPTDRLADYRTAERNNWRE